MSKCTQAIISLFIAIMLLGTVSDVAYGEESFDRATALEVVGEYQAAIGEYEAYLSDHPKNRLSALAAMAIANIYNLALDDPDKAITSYGKVIADYRGSSWAAEAARRQAECLESLKRWGEAGQAYGEALELAGTGESQVSSDWIDEVMLSAADCYHQLGDRSEVIGAYEKALQGSLDPHSAASVLYRLADSYESAGETEKAALNYARIIQDYPFAQVFDQSMAKRELIEPHVSLEWPAYVAYAQTSVDFRGGRLEAVISGCEEILDLTENEVLRQCAEYRKTIAQTTTNGDFTAGVDRLDSLISSLPDPRIMPNAQRQLVQFQAIARLEARAEEMPNDAGALSALGGAYLQARSSIKAVEVLERAAELSAEDEQLRLMLGLAYVAASRGKEAEEAFAFYIERNPSDTGTLNRIGYTYLGVGEAEKAVTYFRRYADVAPDEANAHDSLGEGLLGAGQLAEAAREYEKALELDPSFANSLLMLGRVYRQLEEHDKAADSYRRFLGLTSSGGQANQARQALTEIEGE